MNILAIDPGASGGIAHIASDGSVTTWKMPETDDDLADLLSEIQLCMGIDFCFVEKQGARPAFSDIPGPAGEAQFTQLRKAGSEWDFAEGYGVIKGILSTLKVPREFIRPLDWQKALGIPPRVKKPKKPIPGKNYPAEESHTVWKNRLKAKAQELYPQARITLYVADAILIAEACRRLHSSKEPK